jgi:hypothetical protein
MSKREDKGRQGYVMSNSGHYFLAPGCGFADTREEAHVYNEKTWREEVGVGSGSRLRFIPCRQADNRTQAELAEAGMRAVAAKAGVDLGGNPLDPNNPPEKGQFLARMTSAERKDVPLAVLFDYWPDAMAALARHCKRGNDKHNPGEPLHWARSKSADHEHCIARHLAQRGTFDDDGQRHSVALLWRAACLVQLELEEALRKGEPV